MDDALVHVCWKMASKKLTRVLILVLMDDALVRDIPVWDVSTVHPVLILVLMDDALVQTRNRRDYYLFLCLNPCFNG